MYLHVYIIVKPFINHYNYYCTVQYVHMYSIIMYSIIMYMYIQMYLFMSKFSQACVMIDCDMFLLVSSLLMVF